MSLFISEINNSAFLVLESQSHFGIVTSSPVFDLATFPKNERNEFYNTSSNNLFWTPTFFVTFLSILWNNFSIFFTWKCVKKGKILEETSILFPQAVSHTVSFLNKTLSWTAQWRIWHHLPRGCTLAAQHPLQDVLNRINILLISFKKYLVDVAS